MNYTPLRQPPCPARASLPLPRRRGFSLIEALVSAVIVSLMLVVSLNLLGGAAKSRAGDNGRRTALLLAQQLMSEIQQQPYKDDGLLSAVLFGPELGESTATRADFDDVDDYHNHVEKPVALKDGTPVSGFSGWKRRVKVTWVTPESLAEALLDTGLVRVEVTVADAHNRAATVVALRSRHTVPADPPPAGLANLWTGIELSTGPDATSARKTVSGVYTVSQPAVK